MTRDIKDLRRINPAVADHIESMYGKTEPLNVPPEMSAKLQELRDVFGSVPNQPPLNIPQPPEDQSQPGPWWIVPFFAVLALALVFCGYLVAEAAPLVGVAL